MNRIPPYIDKVKKAMLLLAVLLPLAASCSYNEEIETCNVSVRLIYPPGSIDPYEGARVEMKDATGSIFVDSTDTDGVAHFAVPAGIYDINSSTTRITTDWRYFFNGVKSMNIISRDSTNRLELKLVMSKKKNWH